MQRCLNLIRQKVIDVHRWRYCQASPRSAEVQLPRLEFLFGGTMQITIESTLYAKKNEMCDIAYYWFQHHYEIPIIYKSNLKKIAEIAMRGFLRCRPSFARSPPPPPLAYDCITLHPTKRFLALLKPNGFWAFTLSLLCKLQLHAQNK